MTRIYGYIFHFLVLALLSPNMTSAQCDSEAGTMDSGIATVCPGESLTLIHNGDEFLDANDVMQFVAHDNAGNSLGNIFGTYSDPIAVFAMGMNYGTTYYLSAIVGNDDGTGNVDLTDPCLSVSVGTPIVFSAPMVISSSTIDPSCAGAADGEITIDVAGGTAPYTYEWSNGVTGPTTIGMPSGTYVVTITDVTGCSVEEAFFLLEPLEIICALTVSGDLDCNQTAVVVDLTCTGGVGFYTHLWSNGGTGPQQTIFAPGTYSVTVIDANGCSSETSFTIVDDTQAPIAFITGNTMIDCTQGLTILEAGGTPDPDLFYEWDYQGTIFSTSIIATVSQPGIYCLTVVNAANGCSAVDCVEVTSNDEECGTIQGKIIWDDNLNCLEDPGEEGLSGWMVKAIGDVDFFAFTDANGEYLMHVLPGDYEVEVLLPSVFWTVCENNIAITVVDENDIQVVNFEAQIVEECPLMSVDISTWFLRRCFDSKYYLDYCNSGTATAEDAIIVVEFDDFIEVLDASITYTDLGNNAYQFELGDVAVGACGDFTITVHVSCMATLGETLCAKAHIYPDEPCPGWMGASLEVTAECTQDEVIFTIENVGDSDMTDNSTFIVIEDGVMFMTEPYEFTLNSMESRVETFPANGATWIMDVEQVADHPGNSQPLVAVEGCGTNDDGTFSMGWVTQFNEDDGDTFISIDCHEVIGSWDPNDKRGFPKGYGEEHLIERGQELDYHIRFQNTGTDTAFNILIEDVLSPYLDMTTLRPGTSSHPYKLEILGSDTLHFIFENIMLPDSNINEPASHGFVKFRIAQKPNLDLGTTINNEAAIYFDFNDPVITNKTDHTIGEHFIVNTTQVFIPNVSIQAFPNPFGTKTTIQLEGQDFQSGEIVLYDATGKLIRKQQFEGNEINLERKNLNSGLYLFQIKADETLIGVGKIVVE